MPTHAGRFGLYGWARMLLVSYFSNLVGALLLVGLMKGGDGERGRGRVRGCEGARVGARGLLPGGRRSRFEAVWSSSLPACATSAPPGSRPKHRPPVFYGHRSEFLIELAQKKVHYAWGAVLLRGERPAPGGAWQ